MLDVGGRHRPQTGMTDEMDGRSQDKGERDRLPEARRVVRSGSPWWWRPCLVGAPSPLGTEGVSHHHGPFHALLSTEAVPRPRLHRRPARFTRAQRNPAALGASCDDVDVLAALLSAGADIEQTAVASATVPAGQRRRVRPWDAADGSSNAAPRGRG
jgi:hypothetical protein